MTVFRLFATRSTPPTVSFVIGRSFLVGIRGADAQILAALEVHRGREVVTVEQLIACVPLAADGIDDFIIVTVDGRGGDEASPDAGALSDLGASERRITVVARGELAVEVYSVGGSRRFAARGVRPFALAEFRAVTAFALLSETDHSPSASDLATPSTGLPPGIVEGHGLAWASAEVHGEETAWREPSSEQTVILNNGTRPTVELDDTVLSVPRSLLPPLQLEPELEETTLRQVVGDQPCEPVRRSEPALPEPPIDDTVIFRGSRSHPGDSARAPIGLAENADTVTRSTRLYPVFRLGEQAPEALDGILYLGRSPHVPRQNNRAVAAARALVSPSQAVSGTHASLERSGTTIVVTDLGSRNGTVVYLPDARPRRLRAGESLALPAHSRVDLGDDNVVYVLSPAPVFSAFESGDNS